MRSLFLAALIPATALPATAQQPAAPTARTEAMLVREDNTGQDIWIEVGTKTHIRFYKSAISIEATDMRIDVAKAIYLREPKEFTEAMDLFQGRKYEEAKAKFAEIKRRYKPTETMAGNFSAQGEFYEMECLRKAGDLEGLCTLMQRFKPDPLPREDQRLQVEIYNTFWDAVRTKGWQRVVGMAKDWAERPVPANLRAQIAYCQGLALEGVKKPTQALNAYNAALTADCGASEELAKPAALNILRIHRADPEVQKAISRWGKEDEAMGTAGRIRLLEASAVAHIYLKFVGKDLPPEFRDLLKYKTEEDNGGAKPVEPAKK